MDRADARNQRARAARAENLGVLRRRLAVALVATTAAILVLGPPASAATSVSKQVSIQPRAAFTDTGLSVHAGDEVTITASGKIHFGGGRITQMTPGGIAWGTQCAAIARGQARTQPWPAQGLNCWSLIARIGSGSAIGIGEAKTFRAPESGRLFLGINDNFVRDNSGSWSATVTVKPAAATTTPPASTKKSSSSPVLAIAGGALLLALLLVGLLWRRGVRRKRRDAAALASAAALIAEPALAGAAGGAMAAGLPVVPVRPESAPPETDSIDVNIYEVEFSNGLTLRIGYNHFPEGTEVHWRVTQNRVAKAAGSFVTKGGGSTSHRETVPLGVKLEGRDVRPDGADVQFDWSVNGVPFRYSVRRDPNC